MALTYVNIASQTLSSASASVSFSSIASTYTDLVLRLSVRGTNSGQVNDSFSLTFNGSNTIRYYVLYDNGANTPNPQSAAGPAFYFNGPGSGALASVFGNAEIYIPSYTSTSTKQVNVRSTTENNATQVSGANLILAQYVSLTSAVSSITIVPDNSTQFAIGSSFYLYGIKNA
jgi:hypothetical protein